MLNIFINDYRRKAIRKTIFESEGFETMISSTSTTVTNGGENSLQLKEIRNAVYQLPQIFKVPFLLYFEGYRYNEISQTLNEPLGTLKSRIHFARKLLKEQLTRY